MFRLRLWLRCASLAGCQFATRTRTTAPVMSATNMPAMSRGALLLTSSQRLLLCRAYQTLNLLTSLFVKLANFLVLLLGAERRVGTNRLHLGVCGPLDLPTLLHCRLGDSGLLPAGLLMWAQRRCNPDRGCLGQQCWRDQRRHT
jgi:hypothetical protein